MQSIEVSKKIQKIQEQSYITGYAALLQRYLRWCKDFLFSLCLIVLTAVTHEDKKAHLLSSEITSSLPLWMLAAHFLDFNALTRFKNLIFGGF